MLNIPHRQFLTSKKPAMKPTPVSRSRTPFLFPIPFVCLFERTNESSRGSTFLILLTRSDDKLIEEESELCSAPDGENLCNHGHAMIREVNSGKLSLEVILQFCRQLFTLHFSLEQKPVNYQEPIGCALHVLFISAHSTMPVFDRE